MFFRFCTNSILVIFVLMLWEDNVSKIIGVVPSASLGDMTKSNMNDFYLIGNNYTKRITETGCVPIAMAPVDCWLKEEALDLCDGFIVQGGAEFYPYHF